MSNEFDNKFDNEFDIKLPKPAIEFMNRIIATKKEVYVVGGFVRDSIIYQIAGLPDLTDLTGSFFGKTDIDFTTNMLPDEIISLFPECKIVLTGVKHGTVTVVYEATDGEKCGFEITTYRIDGDYLDNRHPNSVSFSSSLLKDLSRRDFTVNAICYNEQSGIVDWLNGIDDIKNGIIRTIGDPKRRFFEDSLRILRAFRFMATLDFSIEENTLNAAIEFAPLLRNISRERKTIELYKIMSGEKPSKALALMNDVFVAFVDGFVPVSYEVLKTIDDVALDEHSLVKRLAILFSNYDFLNNDINSTFTISKKKIEYIKKAIDKATGKATEKDK